MKRDEDEKAAALEALRRPVLHVIDALPDYPDDPKNMDSVADDLRFAVRLTESLWSKLTKGEAGHERAQQLLFDQQWRFLKPEKADPASLGDDEVPF
jgi:hypothetical protein